MIFDKMSISKRDLWRYVNIKIDRCVNHYSVFGVINILFDEMLKDLQQGLFIDIHNFGTLQIKKTNPKLYHDYQERIKKISGSNRILKFNLAPSLKKILYCHIDDNSI